MTIKLDDDSEVEFSPPTGAPGVFISTVGTGASADEVFRQGAEEPGVELPPDDEIGTAALTPSEKGGRDDADREDAIADKIAAAEGLPVVPAYDDRMDAIANKVAAAEGLPVGFRTSEEEESQERNLYGCALVAILIVALGVAGVFFYWASQGWWFSSSPSAVLSTSPTPSIFATPSATTPQVGMTLNGGAPLTLVASMSNGVGGCAGFDTPATSPVTVDLLNGNITIGFSRYTSLLLTGRVASDGSFTAASQDGSLSAMGMIQPTDMSGTFTDTAGGCTETLHFDASLVGSVGTSPTPSVKTSGPPPTLAPTPAQAIRIAANQISYTSTSSAGTLDFCHNSITVTVGITIDGIAPNTDVGLTLTGRGLPSSLSLTANPGEKVGQSFQMPGGSGSWTDEIVSIGGQPPPQVGARTAAGINC